MVRDISSATENKVSDISSVGREGRWTIRPAFAFFLIFLIWLGSWMLGIADALPYGGTSAPLQLAVAITWAFLIWLGFKVVVAVLRPFFKSEQHETSESTDVAQPMVLCAHCNMETNADEEVCMWCSKSIRP